MLNLDDHLLVEELHKDRPALQRGVVPQELTRCNRDCNRIGVRGFDEDAAALAQVIVEIRCVRVEDAVRHCQRPCEQRVPKERPLHRATPREGGVRHHRARRFHEQESAGEEHKIAHIILQSIAILEEERRQLKGITLHSYPTLA